MEQLWPGTHSGRTPQVSVSRCSARFRFDASWWQAGLRWTGAGNPNQRWQALPPAWIWLMRTQWGLGAVLTRIGADGSFGEGLREVLA